MKSGTYKTIIPWPYTSSKIIHIDEFEKFKNLIVRLPKIGWNNKEDCLLVKSIQSSRKTDTRIQYIQWDMAVNKFNNYDFIKDSKRCRTRKECYNRWKVLKNINKKNISKRQKRIHEEENILCYIIKEELPEGNDLNLFEYEEEKLIWKDIAKNFNNCIKDSSRFLEGFQCASKWRNKLRKKYLISKNFEKVEEEKIFPVKYFAPKKYLISKNFKVEEEKIFPVKYFAPKKYPNSNLKTCDNYNDNAYLRQFTTDYDGSTDIDYDDKEEGESESESGEYKLKEVEKKIKIIETSPEIILTEKNKNQKKHEDKFSEEFDEFLKNQQDEDEFYFDNLEYNIDDIDDIDDIDNFDNFDNVDDIFYDIDDIDDLDNIF